MSKKEKQMTREEADRELDIGICQVNLSMYPLQLKWKYRMLARRKGMTVQDLMIEVHKKYMDDYYSKIHWEGLWKQIKRLEYPEV